jgi:hypothetical protein
VYAGLVASAPTHAPAEAAEAAVPRKWPAPAVPAPAALVAQGLTLADNATPLGTLRLTGSPARAWAQSSAPLDFQAAALAAYFGILHSTAQQERAWWADLAPKVPVSAAGALWGGRVGSYGVPLSVTLRANGTKAVSATLTATVTVTSPDEAGRYDLRVGETVKDGKLHVTRVRLKAIAHWSPAAPAPTASPASSAALRKRIRRTRVGSA